MRQPGLGATSSAAASASTANPELAKHLEGPDKAKYEELAQQMEELGVEVAEDLSCCCTCGEDWPPPFASKQLQPRLIAEFDSADSVGFVCHRSQLQCEYC